MPKTDIVNSYSIKWSARIACRMSGLPSGCRHASNAQFLNVEIYTTISSSLRIIKGSSRCRLACVALFCLLSHLCASDGASAQILEGRLKQIGESKVVKLAYRSDANPFSFVDPQGQPDGYTIDLCKFVVNSIERQLNAKLTIEWVPVDTKSRFDAVATGLADMECGSSTVSFERMAKVDFSSFIFMENTGLMVVTIPEFSTSAIWTAKRLP